MDKKESKDINTENVNNGEQNVDNRETTTECSETNSDSETEEDALSAMTRERDELKDQFLRKVAEFENYRKRTLKEKAELILNGGENLMNALLPVLDDLGRAQDNMNKSDNIETLREGVNLILDKLQKVLDGQGLKRIETEGKDFDTDFHEAIALIPATDDSQKGKIVDCTQTGYMLNNKVIRHAKVVVAQ